jgi:hypothetical protein
MNVVEAFQSGNLTKGRNPSGELRYIIFGVDMTSGFTEQSLIDAVNAVAPATFANLKRDDTSVEQLNNEVWTASVRYSPIRVGERVVAQNAPYALSFSTQGESVNVQQAIEQTAYSLTDTVSPAQVGLSVNVDMDGSPQGVDIVAPRFEFSETHVVAASLVEGNATIPANATVADVVYSSATTIAWTKLVSQATGTVNTATFRGFGAGEVLFLGLSGARQPDGGYEVTYSFVVSRNETVKLPKFDLAGDTIPTSGGGVETVSISKGGHDYLWFHHMERFAGDDKMPRRFTQARAAFLARVYPKSTFSAFVP